MRNFQCPLVVQLANFCKIERSKSYIFGLVGKISFRWVFFHFNDPLTFSWSTKWGQFLLSERNCFPSLQWTYVCLFIQARFLALNISNLGDKGELLLLNWKWKTNWKPENLVRGLISSKSFSLKSQNGFIYRYWENIRLC